jgi:hypothetical protein
MDSSDPWCRPSIVSTHGAFARSPGKDLSKLDVFMGNSLPADFKAFHAEFAEAMLVGLRIPFHLFDLETIFKTIHLNCPNASKPSMDFWIRTSD